MRWVEIYPGTWKLSIPRIGVGYVWREVESWGWNVYVSSEEAGRWDPAPFDGGMEPTLEDAKRQVEEILELVEPY